MKVLTLTTLALTLATAGALNAQSSLSVGGGLNASVDASIGTETSANAGATATTEGRVILPPDAIAIAAADVVAETLVGAQVFDRQGEEVGEVAQVIVEGDVLARMVVETGGFLGFGARSVLLDASDATIVRAGAEQRMSVHAALSAEAMATLPKARG